MIESKSGVSTAAAMCESDFPFRNEHIGVTTWGRASASGSSKHI